MNKKLKPKGVVYSTNPNFQFKYSNKQEKRAINANEQNLKVCIDKHRAGKTAVVIKNFIGSTNELKSLSKMLKSKCGVGGTAKNGEIIIQGNLRDQVINILEKEGYNCKRVGG